MAQQKKQQQPQGPSFADVYAGYNAANWVWDQASGALVPVASDAYSSAMGAAPSISSSFSAVPAVSATESALGLGPAAMPFGTEIGSAGTATAMAPATTATTAAAETSLGSLLGTTGNVLGVVGGGLGAYNIANNFGELDPFSGAASGLGVAAGIGGLGALAGGALAPLAVAGGPIGLGIGALAGLGLSAFKKSGKDKDQKVRDKVRGALKKAGVIDQDNNLTLAGGEKFDIGVDGKTKPFNVDEKRPGALDARGWAIPLGYLVGGGEGKVMEDFTGYITNASLSNADDPDKIRENVKTIADKFGDVNTIKGSLADLNEQGKLSKERYDAALNSLDSLYGINAYAKGGGGGGKSQKKRTQSAPKQQAPEAPDAPIDFTHNYLPSPIQTSPMPGDVMPMAPGMTGAPGNYGDLLQAMAKRAGASYA